MLKISERTHPWSRSVFRGTLIRTKLFQMSFTVSNMLHEL